MRSSSMVYVSNITSKAYNSSITNKSAFVHFTECVQFLLFALNCFEILLYFDKIRYLRLEYASDTLHFQMFLFEIKNTKKKIIFHLYQQIILYTVPVYTKIKKSKMNKVSTFLFVLICFHYFRE